MKKALKLLGIGVVFLVLFTGLFVSYAILKQDTPHTLNHAPMLQERTAHMIRMYSVEGSLLGQCSSTAVGSHALLTAEHCFSPAVDSLRLDWARHVYKVKGIEKDENEHLIYLVDGPALVSTQHILTQAPVISEPVFIFGFAEGEYPSVLKQGLIVNEYDPSEVDHAEGLFYASIHAIPGDSGSAVYNRQGYILGLITFGTERDFFRTQSGIYPLRFTPAQITKVETYEYKETLSGRSIDFTNFTHIILHQQ